MKKMNPWFSIWIKPRKTLRSILNQGSDQRTYWLVIMGGMLTALTWLGFVWSQKPEQIDFKRPLFIIFALIAGAIVGLIHFYFGGWLYLLTGSWLKGKGTYKEVRYAIGWFYYPTIISALLAFALAMTITNIWLQGILSILYFIITIWSIVIGIKLLAEAHQFSAWKSILTVLFAIILVVAAFALISLLVPLLAPLFSAFF